MEGRAAELVLTLRRVLPAPRPAVFAAFTDEALLAAWWGPAGFTIPGITFPARVGERYRITMQPPEGEPFHLTGAFHVVDPPDRLEFTFAWEPPDPDDVETLVRLAFREVGEATEVAHEQGPFTTEARRALHRAGWTESLDKLEAALAR